MFIVCAEIKTSFGRLKEFSFRSLKDVRARIRYLLLFKSRKLRRLWRFDVRYSLWISTSFKHLCCPGRACEPVRVRRVYVSIPTKRHDLRLSVESSALFTLKDEHPDRLLRRLFSYVVSWPSPSGIATRAPHMDKEWVFTCARASSRDLARRAYSCTYLETRKIFCTSRVILTVHSHFYYERNTHTVQFV